MVRNIILLASLGLLSSACSVYSPSTGTSSPTTSSYTPVASASVSLSEADIRVIRAYYADTAPGNGRKGKGGLPPGIAKNLQAGKPLPPGIAKQHLPRELAVELPRAGDGLEYLIVAGKLLLVEAATQIVREILLDAVFD